MTARTASRDHLLAELGVVRYRLRTPTAAGSLARAVAPAPAAASAPSPGATRREPVADGVLLQVSADGCSSAPVSGAAARVWSAVLAWAGLEEGQVHWHPRIGDAADPEAVVALPAPGRWSDPEGKRGLWLALKGPVRRLRAQSRA